MRKIVLIIIVVMMLLLLSVASIGVVGTPDKTSDATKEKEQVITGEDKKGEPVIIGFKERLDKKDRERIVKEHDGKVSHSYRIINAVASRIPPKAIDKLKKNPKVKYVECDYIVNATAQQLPWGVDRIGAPIVHGYDSGSGIKVAILDSGIDHDHPDLHDTYVGGIDYVNDDNDPMDDRGHGTHCAGIVAAMDNEIGVIGVAPEVSLYGVKVLDSEGDGYISDIIAGIEWSVNNDMQVISMSFGGRQSTSALQEACDAASNSGVVLVAAAGNRGSSWMPSGSNWDNVDYPAKYESVIAVAATDSMDERPYWSSTGASVELAAPGVDINSTCWDDTYTTKKGTSMACPHVSGIAALILATPEDRARDANNDGTYETDGDGVWTNNEVRALLQATADDLGDPGRDNLYGFGLVNASKAAPPSGDDTTGPMTSDISADPDPTNGADSVTLTASISDSTTGNSDIVEAEYFVDTIGTDGDGTPMNPSDGAFDSATEGVTADIDVSGWAVGSYTLYVHGNDSAGNWGATASLVLNVTAEDTTGPLTYDVSADPNPTNGADSVTLTASISDSSTGNSDIATAEYFVDTVGADGTGTSMGAVDGTFDSPAEDVTAAIDVSGWVAGSYTLYVHGTDAAGNWGTTEQVALDVTTDDTGPMTSGVSVDPDPTNGADSVTLTASISDSSTGNSDIATAEYFVDTVGADGTGTSMGAVDGTFDSPAEDVTAAIDVSGWVAGSYTLYVHGTDAAGNWGTTEQVALDVTTDDTGPMTSGVSVDPDPTNGADSVTLTASISDSSTGNSDIATAEYFVDTVGADGTGTSMGAVDGTFDSPAEDVTAAIDVSGWVAGSYTLYVHGTDAAGNWGTTEQVALDVTTDDTGPMTSGVSVDPDPTNGADSVTLTASISDSSTGNSDIATAEYFVDTVGADGTGTSMGAVDGTFDSPAEDVTAAIDVSGWVAGSYTLYVHGTDAAGNWGTTASVTLDVTEASTNTMMHVDSIDMELIHMGVFYHATATITIVDATDNPVEGATVSGQWEGATNDQDSGVTDYDGQTPPLQSNYRWAPSGTTFTFVVDDVTKDGWTYDPDANGETEDSVIVP